MPSTVKIPSLIKSAVRRSRSEEAEIEFHHSQLTMVQNSGPSDPNTKTTFQNYYSRLERLIDEDA